MPGLDPRARPDDVAALKAMVAAMERTIETDRAAHAALVAERAKRAPLTERIEILRQQLAVLRRGRFGRRSEKLGTREQQLELALEELEIDAGQLPTPEPAVPGKPKR